MARKIVAGNWKMNCDKEEATALVSEILELANGELPKDVTLILCPPAIHLGTVADLLSAEVDVKLGAQNCYSEAKGAYTGEISASMLKSYGVEYVILGHSERREYFKETNEELAKKVDIALKNDLDVIFCCGEVLAEREANQQEAVVRKQLEESLFHLSASDFAKVVIAYEPVWAIGTGKTASSAQAQEIHATIRKMIAGKYGETVANATTIQYGGSAKPGNAPELFASPDVDGGLIGGAALVPRDFIDIAKSYPA